MAKKKQPDFQPTKLRVGKHLPKGRNVTNTSFKSKKIITKDQKLKTSAASASLSDLIRLLRHTSVATKTDALKRIRKYIEMHDSSLSSYFTEILNVTGKLFLDFHSKVRQEALNVIKTAANILSDLQLSSFMNVLTSHINCMMTHINLSIKKDSLNLLSFLLETRPHFICRSIQLLKNLLNMISSEKTQKGNSSKRKLEDTINTSFTAVEWRENVLKLIAEFLEKLVFTFAERKQLFDDEQKVYYDGINPLSIQLYAGGGLTPARLDTSSDLLRSRNKVTEELKSFFSDLVSVVSDVVTEEFAGLNISSDNCTLRPDNVERLNTVTQVLCYIADWYNMGPKIEDENFIPLMNGILRKKLMKGFCYKIHESAYKKAGRKSKELSCAHLNLGIGSLYCFFILGTRFENTVLNERVLFVLADVLNCDHFQDAKTIRFSIRIIQSFLRLVSKCCGEELHKYNQEFYVFFNHLADMASRCGDSPLTKELESFFIEICTEYEYKFLLDCNLLTSWMRHIFLKIRDESMSIDKELFRCINLMCVREYPSFLNYMSGIDPFDFVGLLKRNDVDYQLTIINLITHMTDLPQDFLQSVSDLILGDQELSVDIISKLIRSLYNRFIDPRVSHEEFKEFLKFLLNVSFDILSVEKVNEKYTSQYFRGNKESSSEEKEEYSEELIHHLFYVQSGCSYVIVPSQQWERHSKIFEVCLECLVIPQDRDITMGAATEFFNELLKSKWTFPVHSAISLLKLAAYVYLFEDYCIPQKEALLFSDELLCSSLYYISTVTHKEPRENFKALGISELQNSLGLSKENAFNFTQLIISRFYEMGGRDQLMLLHLLRIIKFLRTKNKISANVLPEYHELFRTVSLYCVENSEQVATLAEIYELHQGTNT